MLRIAYLLLGVIFLVAGVAFFFPLRSKESVNYHTNRASMLTIESSAFQQNGVMPEKYTCDGANASPEISIAGAPGSAKSLVLIMDDPDIPEAVKKSMGIRVFDHWVVFNMPPEATTIPEGATPSGVLGANGAGKIGYTGPCPPREYEPREHRYFFKLYALDATLPLSEGASRIEVEKAMEGHVAASAVLMVRYARK